MPTHYETLGVAPTASVEEIRRAYRLLARRFHPDRHLQSPPVEAAQAARRMSEINQAYGVLSDVAAREHYDLELSLARLKAARAAAGPAPTRPRPTGSGGAGSSAAAAPRRTSGAASGAGAGGAAARPMYHGGGYVEVAPSYGVWTAIFRAIPWLAVIVVLGAIFVFTAFAAANNGDRSGTADQPVVPPRPKVGDCIRYLSPNEIGLVDCAKPNDGRVIELVSIGRPCPPNTREAYLPDDSVYACVRPV